MEGNTQDNQQKNAWNAVAFGHQVEKVRDDHNERTRDHHDVGGEWSTRAEKNKLFH